MDSELSTGSKAVLLAVYFALFIGGLAAAAWLLNGVFRVWLPIEVAFPLATAFLGFVGGTALGEWLATRRYAPEVLEARRPGWARWRRDAIVRVGIFAIAIGTALLCVLLAKA